MAQRHQYPTSRSSSKRKDSPFGAQGGAGAGGRRSWQLNVGWFMLSPYLVAHPTNRKWVITPVIYMG